MPLLLRLLAASVLVGQKPIEPLIQETGEIIGVVTSIIVRWKRRIGDVSRDPPGLDH
jgi:hypothetical protein